MAKPDHNIIKSITCASRGIKHVYKNEKNFRKHIFVSIIVLLLSIYLNLENTDLAIIIFVITFVIVSEMINSVIEYTWDKLEPNHHPVVGIIKDAMAGVVLVSSVASVIIGILIFIKYI